VGHKEKYNKNPKEEQNTERGRKTETSRRTSRARSFQDRVGSEKFTTKGSEILELIILEIPKAETPNTNLSFLSRYLVKY
jgi:hypothetical protein